MSSTTTPGPPRAAVVTYGRKPDAGDASADTVVVAGHSGGSHSYSRAEADSFAATISSLLGEDGLSSAAALFAAIPDGLLLARLLNFASPGLLDARSLNVPAAPGGAAPAPGGAAPAPGGAGSPGRRAGRGAAGGLSAFERGENLNLCLASCRGLGLPLVGIHASDLAGVDAAEDKRHLALGLLFQLVRHGLVAPINLTAHPEIVVLREPGESAAAFAALSAEVLLLRWASYHLKREGRPGVSNFGPAFADGLAIFHLVRAVGGGLPAAPPAAPLARVAAALAAARALGAHASLSPQVVVDGLSKRLVLALCADLFNAAPGLAALTVEEEAAARPPAEDEGAGARDVRSLAAWLTSLQLHVPGADAPAVVASLADLADGCVLAAAIERVCGGAGGGAGGSGAGGAGGGAGGGAAADADAHGLALPLARGLPDWKQMYVPTQKGAAQLAPAGADDAAGTSPAAAAAVPLFRAIINCNYVVTLAKSLGFSLVTLAGPDIVACAPKGVCGVLAQLQRLSLARLLQAATAGAGGAGTFKDGDVLAWANGAVAAGEPARARALAAAAAKAAGAAPASAAPASAPARAPAAVPPARSFRDPSLASGLWLLALVAAVDPRAVRWETVAPAAPGGAGAPPGAAADAPPGAVDNARYALTAARKAGAPVFSTWEDVVEVKPRSVLSTVVGLMARAAELAREVAGTASAARARDAAGAAPHHPLQPAAGAGASTTARRS